MPVNDPKETDDVAGAARAAADPRSMVDVGDIGDVTGPGTRADTSAMTSAGGSQGGDELDDEAEKGQSGPDLALLEDEEQGPAPAQIAELAEGCVRFVAARYGVTLDFEPDTLSFVDQWLRDARAEMTRRPQAGELIQSAAGAYLGEVVRRAFGGSWVTEGEMADWRLCLASVYCAFNPIGMAREALLLGTADGWHAHFELDPGEREAIEARLAALPEVADDEFYAPSTRFDVTEIVIAALRADLQERGLSGVVFAPSDYNLH